MEEYKELREELKNIKTIKDDSSFIAHNIIYNSSFLLEDCERFIEQGKMSFVYPIMRQVYEYIIILMGFDDDILSLEDFISNKNDARFISDLKKRVGTNQLTKVGLKKFTIYRGFMDNLWEILCERTHANFDRLLIQNYEYDEVLSDNEQLKLECKITYNLLSLVFLVCTDVLLGKKNNRSFDKHGKKLCFDTKVCFVESSTGILERLLEIPNSKSLFKNRFNQVKEAIVELKSYQERIGNE